MGKYIKNKRIWAISDTHFGHDNIISKFIFRPFKSTEEMNEHLISTWNKHVKPRDLVLVLGDVFWKHKTAKAEALLQSLNGDKILVLGNHDKGGITRFYNMGFIFVCEEFRMRVEGIPLTFSHYPYRPSLWIQLKVFLKSFKKIRYLDRMPWFKKEWRIHGHTHSKSKTGPFQIHVGYEAWGRPVNLSEIMALIKKGSKNER